MRIAGFDIGGANTDLAIVDFSQSKIENIQIAYEYLPMWSNKEDLSEILIKLIEKICPIDEIDRVGISMTAELVDAYTTKKEGVLDIVEKCENTFNCPIGYVTLDGILKKNQLIKDPIKAAAANWIATSQIATLINPHCIFIDTGSTTTDIIPIKNGEACNNGKSDFERLATGELVYTGTLRTNLTSFIDKIPLNNKKYTVASELFAQTADIYMVLDLINQEDYICDTLDGKGKSKDHCMIRIARLLCADTETLTQSDIIEISKFIHKKQVEQIAEGLKKVQKRENLNLVVTTGLGKDILDKKAAELLNIPVISMDTILTDEECIVAPAIGTAIMINKSLL